MNTSIRNAIRTAAVGAISLGIAVGVAAAPAEAASGAKATLGVVNEGTGYYWIPVDAVFPMSRAAAQDAINHGYTVQMRLWGDDPSSDDLQFTYPQPISMWAGDDGLHAGRSARVARSVLDEDNGWYEGDGDELYVGVRVVNPNGSTTLSVESNRVTGTF
jgi:hypothetical protein